jgi:signal transduction histidine kinase
LFLCITIILVFGVLFVGRPLEALRKHAERVARGEKGIQTAIASSDEIGELAREMNSMTAALDQARVRARSEEAARIEMLGQLRHADRLRIVGELASSVAHDLGTPMGTVSARAQMIASGEVSAERARELAATIVDEIAAMTGSIRQLLDYGRREQPRRVAVEIGAWGRQVVDLVRPLGEQRGIEIRLECDVPELEVEMDPIQMRHVLVNLLSNAIAASPDGAAVEVRVGESEDGAHVEVRDHGAGIPVERLAAIFEPFFTTKAPSEGTGLGLSIARGIVEEHGGHLTARAAPGGGSVFEVVLPLRADG